MTTNIRNKLYSKTLRDKWLQLEHSWLKNCSVENSCRHWFIFSNLWHYMYTYNRTPDRRGEIIATAENIPQNQKQKRLSLHRNKVQDGTREAPSFSSLKRMLANSYQQSPPNILRKLSNGEGNCLVQQIHLWGNPAHRKYQSRSIHMLFPLLFMHTLQ